MKLGMDLEIISLKITAWSFVAGLGLRFEGSHLDRELIKAMAFGFEKIMDIGTKEIRENMTASFGELEEKVE